MVSYTSPITETKFDSVWKMAVKKYYWFKKKYRIRPAANLLGQGLYFLIFLTLTAGLLHEKALPIWQALTGKLPFLSVYWEKISSLLFASADPPLRQVLIAGLCLYGIPMAGALVPALLILLFYHPILPKLSPRKEQHPGDLKALSIDLRQYYPGPTALAYRFFRNLFLLGTAALTLWYILAYQNTGGFFLLFKHHQTGTAFLLLVYWALICLIYVFLQKPLGKLISLLYESSVPTFFFRDVDAYYDAAPAASREAPET